MSILSCSSSQNITTNSFNKEERLWRDFILSSLNDFPDYIEYVQARFSARLRDGYTIKFVTGGGRDAYTEGFRTIVIDLGQWQENYTSKNKEQVLRVIAHEYAHLLSKAQFKFHKKKNLKEKVFQDLFYEGIGHYFSLSEKWKGKDGGLSKFARTKLESLETTLKQKLILLEEGKAMNEDFKTMNIGKFQEKWGALTVALWLLDETKGKPEKFKTLTLEGPKLIEFLAQKKLGIIQNP